jgi:hypothetical protein
MFQFFIVLFVVLVLVVCLAFTVTNVIEKASNLDDPQEQQDLIKKTVADNSERKQPLDPADFLVLITAECSGYMDWQSLAAYDQAKKVWPEAEVVRLLHCATEKRPGYAYLGIMPSVFTSDCSKHPRTNDEYAPLNRPVALYEFFQQFPPEKLVQTYVVIMDSDTLLRRRMNHVQVEEGRPVGQLASILVAKMYTAAKTIFGDNPGLIKTLPLYDIGSPYILHKNDAAKLAKVWRDHTNLLRENTSAKHVIGWIAEMYSFITAAAMLKLDTVVRSDLQARWPYDSPLDVCSYHYDSDHEKNGKRWSKRDYMMDLLKKGEVKLMPGDFTPNVHTKTILEIINASLQKWRSKA